MSEEPPLHGSGGGKNPGHAYPRDLAAFVARRWEDHRGASDPRAPGPPDTPIDPLPTAPVLEEVLSTCYQASLLREEDQPVLFRLASSRPEVFPTEGGPPRRLHRLDLPELRPFDARELRRLSPATDYPRSIVGVRHDGEEKKVAPLLQDPQTVAKAVVRCLERPGTRNIPLRLRRRRPAPRRPVGP